MTRRINTVAFARCFGFGIALLVHRTEATVLMRRHYLTAAERSHYIQLRREHNQIGIRSDDKATFRFQTDSARGIFRRHRDGFIQRNVHLAHHHAHEVDHARGAARES